MMKILIALLLSISFSSLANETIKKDNLFAVEYMDQFKKGMKLSTIFNILSERKKNVEFYNNCLKDFQYPMTECVKGYSLVTTIKLPNFDKSLGKGDLQMYFSFDDKQKLYSTMFELYYPAHH